MFDSSIEHLYKPPAIDRYDPLKTIHIKLTKSSEKLRNGIEYYKKKFEYRRNIRNTKLNDIAPVSANRVLNVEKYITRRYVSENDFVNSNLWKIHQQVVNHVGSRDTYFPYDIACNMIRNNVNRRLHSDYLSITDQWTMVTYLNPNWTAQMGEETAYFESADDDNNYITEVRSHYGRSALSQDGRRCACAQARLNRLSEDFMNYALKFDGRKSLTDAINGIGNKRSEKMIQSMILGEDAGEEKDDENKQSQENQENQEDQGQEENHEELSKEEYMKAIQEEKRGNVNKF
ncbi:hypothetical protein TrispH2_007335 [Trichoplax sp. H2]|nr:hypothetical protein TrispH2_007335 [Trichoplax sp. H2]|eukprot:RDD40495.1 hypothetical protein TrispH2_007335 [Trichoplax sp. H2]